jgi:hypothetical protein
MLWPMQSSLAHIKRVTGSARQVSTFPLLNSDLKRCLATAGAALLPEHNILGGPGLTIDSRGPPAHDVETLDVIANHSGTPERGIDASARAMQCGNPSHSNHPTGCQVSKRHYILEGGCHVSARDSGTSAESARASRGLCWPSAGLLVERRPAQWTRLGLFSRHLVSPDPWNWRIFSERSLQRTTPQVAGRRFD